MRSSLICVASLWILVACDPVQGPGDAGLPARDRQGPVDAALVDAAVLDAVGLDLLARDGAGSDRVARDVRVNDSASFDAALADVRRADATTVDVSALDRAPRDSALSDVAVAADRAAVDGQGADRAQDAGADSGVLDATGGSDGVVGQDLVVAADAALGWPFDASLPAACASLDVDTTGSAWNGWGNYQWPDPLLDPGGLSVEVNETTDFAYGQVYQQGVTEAVGQASGWQAELLVGPWGTRPDQDGQCWQSWPGTFYADRGNNDEYRGALSLDAPGLYGLFWRYRPAGGRWLYGDRDPGSSDGLQVEQAALLEVHGARDGRLVVATLNLRCRVDSWAARRPLVVDALARVDADLVAFEEDCAESGGFPQSQEILELLARRSGRGYQIVRAATHTASYTEGDFSEGISVLSAHAVIASHVLDLPPTPVVPPANFPRKAVAVDVMVAGHGIRFYATHLEFGANNQTTRQGQAAAILADLPGSGSVFVGGDFNATPDEPALVTLRGALADLWQRANPSDPGLTMPAAVPTRRIDYLMSRSPCVGALQGARLLDEHSGSTWLSDHRGVAATCTWP
ncbi:MAG: endonuclease/exonuclease/phosphatase family protein [Pseudomonadota bacterium]